MHPAARKALVEGRVVRYPGGRLVAHCDRQQAHWYANRDEGAELATDATEAEADQMRAAPVPVYKLRCGRCGGGFSSCRCL